MDKVRRTSGKLYLSGAVVIHPDNTGLVGRFGGSRNRTKRNFKLSFKAKNKLYDAITFQNYQASCTTGLYHCFVTLTFSSSNIPDNPNKCVSEFFNRWRKQGARSYTWVREVGEKGGLVHYHATTLAPFRNVADVNRTWCDCRGYYSPNAVRTAPGRGMVIRSLTKARKYVAKYMTKSETKDQQNVKGRVYAISNDLIFEPLAIDSGLATSLMHDQYRSNGYIYRGDFATIGQLKSNKSLDTYFGFKELLERDERLKSEKEFQKQKAIEKRKLIEAEKRKQLTISV